MSQSPTLVECVVDGTQPQAFVCQHLVDTLDTGVEIGFHWSQGDTTVTPDAWCNGCEEARLNGGGEWTDAIMATVGIKLLCASCYHRAKEIWLNARAAAGLGTL